MLIGIFDGLVQMPNTPVCSRLCIVNRWCCGQGSFRERTRIVGPDNGPVVMEGKEIVVRLPDTESSVTNVEFFLNVKIGKEGVYWVEIMIEGDLKLRYPLRVNRVSAPPPPGGNEGQA